MLKRTALIGVLAVVLLGTVQPGFAGTYTKNYVGSTDGLEIVTTNPARDYGNPADNGNAVANIENFIGYLGLEDASQRQVYTALNGTPANSDPLTGTPADTNALKGTPADQEVAGVLFTGFSGKPSTVAITDTVGSQLGVPVRFVALQCSSGGENPRTPHPCPSADVVEQLGCADPATPVRLSGFVAGHSVAVFVVTNDSPGLWGTALGESCDGLATGGKITLVTV